MTSTPPPEVPELFGVPVAVLAFIVAGGGFVLSLLSLGWNIFTRLREGGRLRVSLNSAVWHPDLMLSTNRTGRWGMSPDAKFWPEHLELAQLVVENPGRVPVTIHTPSLWIQGHGRKNHTISPRAYALKDYGSDTAITDSVYRLEPFDRITYLFEYWPMVPKLMESAGRRGITIRGVVSVAARKKFQKSTRRRAWHIPKGAYSVRGEVLLGPYTVIWRELFRDLPAEPDLKKQDGNRVTRGMVNFFLRSSMEEFEERPPREELMAVLEEKSKSIGTLIAHTALWNAYAELDRLKGHLGPWKRPKVEKSTPEATDPVEESKDD